MGRPKKVRNRKKFNYNKDRRKAWRKKNKQQTIIEPEIKKNWDDTKSVQHNMISMGLSFDPNKTLPVPKTKNTIGDVEQPVPKSKRIEKSHVVDNLEKAACVPEQKTLRLSQPEVSFCTYMMEKYGEDYKAMARDERNYYQDTPKQIRRRILTFKGIPQQYNAYLSQKASGAPPS